MKKLIIILLFSVGLQAQTKYNDFYTSIKITKTVEANGHQYKKGFTFYCTEKGVFILDENKVKYQIRECDEKDCNIIHLEPKSDYTQNGSIRLTPWLLNNTTTTNGL